MSGPCVLVTGATGLLGPYLVEAMQGLGPVVTTARQGAEIACDLTDAEAVRGLIGHVRPEIVVHAAGMTDVDACEREPAAAHRANAASTGHLARALGRKARLVYVSTDQVYPDRPGPHGEDDAAPVNAYGRSKRAGERAAAAHGRALIVRTNFFGPSRTPSRQSLSDFFAEAFARGRPVTLFRDSLFSPLHMETLAALLAEMLARGLEGTFNLGSRDGLSKHDFALAVARRLGLSVARAVPGEARGLPGRAPRPADLRLDVARIERALGRPMPRLACEIARLRGR